jgi:hypothetical protein
LLAGDRLLFDAGHSWNRLHRAWNSLEGGADIA